MDRSRPQFSVLGLPVHILDDYAGWLIERLHQGLGSHVVTLNAEMAMQAEKNTALADVIRSAELVIPDGSGVVLYLRMRGKPARRYPGIELAESLLQQAGKLPDSEPIFFFGGAPGVTAKAAETWQQKVKGLSIASQHGYLTADEEKDFRDRLQKMQPKLIFVGLGVPRQEFWIAENRHLCPQSIWVGVGGSFDIWAGTKDRAPAWFCDNHLEWLYRLYQEPWRWRRMLALPQFALKALGDLRG
ncbi:WecB/TagA/CpsF family glycosyltransferase [Tychonema sp. LEGE 07203]|uniref:WecB/TagA/CpsF family glycosyltransferase n=1 Tax=Tychonema sp. LEGE 07203 TaxID=1828671 RepID=UPI0018807283|nr:WecB/TagA/CpsF family glycosyltransferase [Tychonema sp. LEGE 07203]MBE9097006.1 WecB/TagA/CpsF family glycosyltransferase [Tychonema sp. LEGE 07203]